MMTISALLIASGMFAQSLTIPLPPPPPHPPLPPHPGIHISAPSHSDKAVLKSPPAPTRPYAPHHAKHRHHNGKGNYIKVKVK